MRRMLCLALFTLIASSAVAQTGARVGDFICTPVAQFADYSVGNDTVKINNFSVREVADNLAAGANTVQITYSVANRSQKPAYITADFILFNTDYMPIAAVNSNPFLRTVAAGTTETATGQTIVSGSFMEKVKTICSRIWVVNE